MESIENLSLKLDNETYVGEIHNSIPLAIFKELEKGTKKYEEIFQVYKPSRVFLEGESTNYWENTEDFIITGSHNGGEIIMGQVVSCSSKNYPYNKMKKQLDYFESNYQNQFHQDPLKNLLKAKYIVAVDIPSQIVKHIERKVEMEIKEEGSYELDLIIKKVPTLDKTSISDPKMDINKIDELIENKSLVKNLK